LVKNQIAHGRHIILSNSLYRVIIALMSKIKVLILAGILVLIIGAVRGYTGYFDDIASINTIYPTTTPSPTPTLTPTPTPTMTPTPTPTLVPPTPTSLPVVNYEELFETYANHYSVDKDILKRIAICESKLNPVAANGDYLGIFQFASITWQVTRASMGLDSNPELRNNPEESIRAAAFKIASGGERAWQNCL